jgi:nodulation protein E
MSNRRVVVTGLGAISALGLDQQALLAEVQNCRSGIREIESVVDERLGFRYGAEIPGFDAKSLLPSKEDQALDRCVQVGLISAREAVADSGLVFDEELGTRTAIVFGCAVGGRITENDEYEKFYGLQKKRFHPMTIPKVMGNAGASRVSVEFGITGPVYTVSTACSSANHAMGQAFWMVRGGGVDIAITGGHEAFFCLGHLKAWDALRVVDPETCRPFCRDRAGMILGEAGATLVLESLDHAKARGAKIYAEVVGFGMTADAHHLTMPSTEGPARAMSAALRDGMLSVEDVTYINAHGTGTPANDPNETRAIRLALGDHADSTAVSSTKALHGHALGSAGAIEAAITVQGIHHGFVPPTANFTEADPECDLDYVPNEAREGQIDVALSNSFAFGGLNAVLAFRRFQ